MLPYAYEHNIGALVYGPLAHGLLTGAFDAGFGPGTKPGDVASYLVERLCGDAAKAKKPPV